MQSEFHGVETSGAACKHGTLEENLFAANFANVDAYETARCSGHHRFFEVNLYQKDAVSKHYRPVNFARPATWTDL